MNIYYTSLITIRESSENDTYANDDNTSSDSTQMTSTSLQLTRLVVQTYLVPIVVAFGLIGNLLNMLVLVNPKMRSSTNVYLLSLAICDSLYLLFCLTLSFLHCSNKRLSKNTLAYITIARVVSDMFGNTAVWLTVCFTMERFIAVK